MFNKMILVTLFYFAELMDDSTLIFVDKHGVNITLILHCIQVFEVTKLHLNLSRSGKVLHNLRTF